MRRSSSPSALARAPATPTHLLLALLLACTRAEPPPARLEVREVGDGHAGTVVLLHGHGASGTDLVSLSNELPAPPGTRFVFPAAPLEVPGWPGARTWFELDVAAVQRGLRAGDDRVLARQRPPGLPAARRAVADLLARAHRPVALGGFSQGAMVASHVALTLEPPPACVLLLSPGLVDEAALAARRRPGLRVFVSHGRGDRILPVSEARRLVALLERLGAAVTYLELDHGHTLPAPVLEAAGRFLGGCLQEGAAGSVK